MHQASEVSFPSTNLEVEIVLPIPFGVLKAVYRCPRILLCESMKGLHDDNEAARKDTSRNAFQGVHECLRAPGHAVRLARIVAYQNTHSRLIRYSHFNLGLYR